MSPEDDAYLNDFRTVSFLVIQNDSIVYEEYRSGWNDTKTSNIFSSTKSIVGLLVGIAYDEGKIASLDDSVGKYIPEFNEGKKKNITIRNLLTMSGGLNWDEAYASLFSVTTHGYYGNDLYDLVTTLDVIEEPGETIFIPERGYARYWLLSWRKRPGRALVIMPKRSYGSRCKLVRKVRLLVAG